MILTLFRTCRLAVVLLLAGASLAHAQLARPALMAVDSSVAVDRTDTVDSGYTSGVTMDAVMTMGLGAGFEAMVRPWIQKTAAGEWNRQIWVAALRYQRPGPESGFASMRVSFRRRPVSPT